MFFISYIRYTSYSLCFNNLLHISMKNSFSFLSPLPIPTKTHLNQII